MADALETKIQAILTKYTEITSPLGENTGGEELAFLFGERERNEHGDCPRVSWVETGGGIEKARGPSGDNAGLTTGEEPEAQSMWCDLDVEIWRETGEECRNCYFNLIAAARGAADGSDLRYTRYRRITDHHKDRGVVFSFDMSVRVPTPLYGTRGQLLVTIGSHYGEYTDDANVNVDGSSP